MPEYVLDHSLAIETWRELDEFTRGYITAAMWTLTDGERGESCDHLGLHDIADETIKTAITESADFVQANRKLMDQTGADDFRHGADFWLTRNGHGAGFWDRGYGDVGDKLTDAAHAYGSADWYVGDDGNVYQM